MTFAQLVEERDTFLRAVADPQPDQHIRQTHDAKTDAALVLLLLLVLVEEVRCRVDDVVQEAHGIAYRQSQVVPVDLAIFDEVAQIQRSKVTNAPCW